ncbi:MAG: hypothetical protein Q8T03_08240 [Bacteroidota bacterium]|nr:hypothetical protein [Bacteroidota bacterium]
MFKITPKYKVSVSGNSYYFIELEDDVEFEVKDLKQLVELEKELSGKILPVLVVCPPNATTNNELLDYISKNKNNPFSKADAFVIFSLAQKILANVYIKLKNSERPVKFFTKKEDALKWLTQFID